MISDMENTKFTRSTEALQNKIQSFAFVISATVCTLFCVGFAASDARKFGQSCEIKLDSRINPNDAPVASLVRLPSIGISRAVAIVAWRENFAEQEGKSRAFENADDLQKVKGIGPKTAKNMSKWLKFE